MKEIPEGLRDEIDELARRFDQGAVEIQQSQPHEMKQFTDPEQYRQRVLPLELDLMRCRQPAIEPRPRVLVLLCGISLQPLLVSVAFSEPEQVLLVGSDTTEGRIAVARVRGLLNCRLMEPDLYIHDSDPIQGYANLEGRLRKLGASGDVVVDITGGKKPMVLAAFLAAARLGLSMVYVDGKHDPTALLPRPGTLYLRTVGDPAAYFWLRELKDAATHFSEGGYGAAALLYQQVAKAVEKEPATSLFPVEKLRQAAARALAARYWEDASYSEAAKVLRASNVRVPQPLQVLAQIWGTDEEKRLERFSSSQKQGPEQGGRGLLYFTADRLAWAYRAYRGNRTREALLRGFAACDTALEGLVIWLLKNNRWQPEGKPFKAMPKSMHGLMVRARSGPLLETGAPNSPPKDHVNRFSGLGETYKTFAQRDTASPEDELLREHRNALIHRISAPDLNLTKLLLDAPAGQLALAERLLLAVGVAMEIGLEAQNILHEALADPNLSALRPDLPGNL